MKLDEAEPAAAERWQEVLDHNIGVVEAIADPVDEGYVVLELDKEDASDWGIYPVLSISTSGTIAEYSVNQPYHYPSFQALLTVASVRTAST